MEKGITVGQNHHILLLGLSVVFLSFLAASNLRFTGMVVGGCVDSDGNDPFTAGKVAISGDMLEDRCSDTSVVEFLCVNDNLKFAIVACEHGCVNGACQQAAAGAAVQGESFAIGTAGDLLELNEALGDVTSAITDNDLSGLATGMVSGSSKTEYRQYLRFANGFTSGKVVFGEDEDNNIGDFLFFQDGQTMFEYSVDFSDGWESSVSGNQLDDLIGRAFQLLGKKFKVVDAQKQGNQVELTFLRGDFEDLLGEGSTITYSINGQEIVVEVLIVEDSAPGAVTLVVDGQTSSQLEEGETFNFGSGVLGVSSIMLNEAGEGSSDLVEIFLGSQVIEMKDSDVTDSSFTSAGIEIDGNRISDGLVMIKGNTVGSDFEIISLDYRLQADAADGGDLYIPVGGRMSEELREPEGLLGSIDFVYGGFSDQGSSVIELDPQGNDEYRLEFENAKSTVVSVPLVVMQNGLSLGDDDQQLMFIEASNSTNYSVALQDYAVLTNRNDHSGITSIVEYRNIDTSNKVVDFDELGVGVKSVTYQGTEGIDATGTLVVGGNTYRFYVGPLPYNLAMDLTGDGNLNSGEANIVVNGGGMLDLGSTNTPGGNFTITLTTQSSKLDEGGSNEVIQLEMITTSGRVDVGLSNQSSLMTASDSHGEYGRSAYGVSITKDDDDPDTVTIEYPLQQTGALVTVELPLGAGATIVKSGAPLVSGASMTCFDGIKNADEDGVDCGGACPDCVPIIPPQQPETPPPPPVLPQATCVDYVQNQGETGVDCGGPCPPCQPPVEEQPTQPAYGDGFWSRLWYGIQWLFGYI